MNLRSTCLGCLLSLASCAEPEEEGLVIDMSPDQGNYDAEACSMASKMMADEGCPPSSTPHSFLGEGVDVVSVDEVEGSQTFPGGYYLKEHPPGVHVAAKIFYEDDRCAIFCALLTCGPGSGATCGWTSENLGGRLCGYEGTFEECREAAQTDD